MKKALAVLMLLCCMMSMVSVAMADVATFAWPRDYSTVSIPDAVVSNSPGDGETRQVFFVTSNGGAWIELKQTKGTCHELSYTKLWSGFIGTAQEWGKYEICVNHAETFNTVTYRWDDTYNNDTFRIEFPQSGHYYVYVRPYTDSEMTNSYLLDQFVGWVNPPTWWVNYWHNCTFSGNSPFYAR